MVTWHESDCFGLVFPHKFGLALQHDHPLMFALVIPKPGRAAVAGGNDPLDTDLRTIDEKINQFLGQ